MTRRRRLVLAGMMVIIFGAGAGYGILRWSAAQSRAARPKIDPALLARERPPPSPDGRSHVSATWTGVAGLQLTADVMPPPEAAVAPVPQRAVLLVDPFVTRQSVAELAFALDSDEDTLQKAFPPADGILVTHSHWDHLADAITLARRMGVTLYGSQTTCVLAVSQGVDPQRCFTFQDGHRFHVGPFDVSVVAHPHGRTALGVPFDGVVTERAPGPLHAWDMKMGGAFAFVIRVAERTLYVQTSAGLDDAQLARIQDLAPDLALVGIALRQRTPDFEARLIGALKPRRIAAIHHDDFLGAVLRSDVPLMDGVDVRGFERRVADTVGLDALVRLEPFVPYDVPARP